MRVVDNHFMRKNLPYRQILFPSILALALSGCGAGQGGRTPASVLSASTQMVAVANLTTEERAIATRICYAYQSKSTNFQTSIYTNGIFSFNMISKDCSGNRTTYPLKAKIVVTGDGLEYKSTTSGVNYESKIQTSSSGYLSTLCTKIQNNLSISNTATDDGEKVQISFFKDALDSYTIKYFATSKGVTSAVGAETFKVRTQYNLQPGQILGMDEVYIGYEMCSDSDKTTEFYQNFSSFSK